MKVKSILVAGLLFMQLSMMAAGNIYSSAYASDAYASATSAGKFMLDEATEREYAVEPWMSNIQNDTYSAEAKEEAIQLEEWMYNTHSSFWFDLNEVSEAQPVLESWMTNPNEWVSTGNEDLLSLN